MYSYNGNNAQGRSEEGKKEEREVKMDRKGSHLGFIRCMLTYSCAPILGSICSDTVNLLDSYSSVNESQLENHKAHNKVNADELKRC